MNTSTRILYGLFPDPWLVQEEAFPRHEPAAKQLQFMLNYAALAPSSHNTQPWLFRVHDRTVELFADRTRALPVADPDDRELLISCGAALFHLRLAMRYFGHVDQLEMIHDSTHSDLLARVTLGPAYEPTEQERRLFHTMPHRRTNRHAYERKPVEPELLDALREAAEQEGAHLEIIDDDTRRHQLADLVSQGDRHQGNDRHFRRELAAWIHHNRSLSQDGMPGYAFELSDWQSYVGPLIVRTFHWGEQRAARDRELVDGSPVLAVLGTESDDRADLIAAGQGLAHLLLHATDKGLAASYLNQPLEVPDLRSRTVETLGLARRPQIVLRLGYGPPTEATPRRPVDDVLLLN